MNNFINRIFSYLYILIYLICFINNGRPNNKPLHIRRMLFITYVSFLFTSYYFYYPIFTNFINMIIMYILSLILYVIYYSDDIKGIYFHINIIFFPIIYTILFIKFDNFKYSFTTSSFILIFYLIFMYIFKNKIYKKSEKSEKSEKIKK